VLFVVTAAAPAPRVQDPPLWATLGQSLQDEVKVHRLANGMTFILLERHEAPIFGGVIRFRVGGVDEEPGKSGLAHLFEHLAFKGTRHIGTRDPEREAEFLVLLEEAVDLEEARRAVSERQDAHRKVLVSEEFSELYSANGAVGMNATTNKDLTSYFVSLPANRLEFWCLMESERLRDGVLREFYSERDVVIEERLRGVETSPFGKLYEKFLDAAYGNKPYGIPTVGWLEDLKGLRTSDAEAFRRRHYRPRNAVAALVGDFHIPKAIELIERYFGEWQADGPEPKLRPATQRSEAPSKRPMHVEVPFESQTYLLIGFDKPVAPHPDAATFDILHELLEGGRSSRLYRRLVLERQMALHVFTFEGPGQRLDNLFIVGAIPQAPHSAKDVEEAILDELADLARSGVEEKEMQKARNALQTSFVEDLDSPSGLALELSYHQSLYGDWRQMLRSLEAASEVQTSHIQKLAARYLDASRRVAAEIVPLHREAPQTQEKSPEETP
jgi:predicted Zn-dependent peptidase